MAQINRHFRKLGITLFLCFSFCNLDLSKQKEKTYKPSFPDKMIDNQIIVGQKIYFSAYLDTERVFNYSPISMNYKEITRGDFPKIIFYKEESKLELIFTCTRQVFDVTVLLPEGKKVSTATLNGIDTETFHKIMEGSTYAGPQVNAIHVNKLILKMV
jgi:hypothetical protein